jgi:lipid-A-disaccharide synthase
MDMSASVASPPNPPRRIFLVAGEASGDLLGAGLMGALQERSGDRFTFHGVGGPQMHMRGLKSLFPISDIAVMGIGPVLARLPLILRRISETAAAAISDRPDAIVLIDSPDFTHRVAAKIRRVLPSTPIIVYVSPTVWFWRPGRALKLARFCDRLLALLPFEPAVHKMLAGPPTTYVGHPFVEKRGSALAMRVDRSAPLSENRQPKIVVLPGSRRSEVRRLLKPFGEALALLASRIGPFDLVLPVVEHVRADIEAAIDGWTIRPTIVSGEAAKLLAFAEADVALAASGTVTLELGLARVPTVAAYRLDWIGRWVKHLLKPPKALAGLKLVRSAQLTNVIVGEMVVPEFIDGGCTPPVLADALEALLRDTPERRRQFDAFDRLAAIMQPQPEFRPNVEAALAVLELISQPKHGTQRIET